MMATQNNQIGFSDQQQRKPIQLKDNNDDYFTNSIEKLPPINNNNDSKSLDTKKVFKWRFWWEKNDSNIRIPIFESPSKLFENTQAKVASLDFVNHKPGGGNVKVVSEKPVWKKISKIEQEYKENKDYKPKGGQVKILNEKVTWHATPKVASLDFVNHKPGGGTVKIIEQPFKKTGIKSRVDTGLILEEVEVPYDYETLSPTRANTRSTFRDGFRSSTQMLQLKDAIKDTARYTNR